MTRGGRNVHHNSCPDGGSAETNVCSQWVAEQLVSNNGLQFVSEEFASFCKFNGMKHISVSPYHLLSNGLVKRFVQMFKVAMRKSKKDGLSLQHCLARFILLYRAMPQGATATSPSALFMGCFLRPRLNLLQPHPQNRLEEHQASQKQHWDLHS